MFEAPLLKKDAAAPPREPAIDAEWYARFEKIGAFQAYEYLSGKKEYSLDDAGVYNGAVNEEQKQLFLRGEVEIPKISYPKLEKLDASKIEQSLLVLKQDIARVEKNEIVRQAYLWKINEKVAEIRMLRSAQQGDDRRFTRYSKFIFGEPDQTIFDYTLFELSKKLRGALASENPLIKNIAERLGQELLGGKTLSHTEHLSYSATTSEIALEPSRDNAIQFPKNLAPPEAAAQPTTLSPTEIVAAFEAALEKYALAGWRVALSETHMSISVNQETRTVNVPKERRLSQIGMEGLIAHEIGVHAQRRERGDRSKLSLLGLGLDRHKDDEGIATLEEQKVAGAKEFAGFGSYLAIALAMGADGKKRNFREVFELLRDYHLVQGKAPAKAANAAWGICLRTFRGTTGETRGACFTKDLIYREGNIGVWHLVQEDSAEQRRFTIGRYDPNNARHIWVLDQLGITDEDLSSLDKAI